ncbi:acidic mammalian chitinase-like [Hibiscus syriacus]|uniref:Acidic mammalian chitinase-like n=1 Tax=Hibiscus syriacus TaxID=106335 RepID=A0A6A2YHP5_HIBSY|nr:acidic mammalian chitinase-like [Hibiscus syriacus]
MAWQRISTSFLVIAVIVLAADVSFSTASFPSLLTRKSGPTSTTPRSKPACTSPSPSQPLAPSPSPYADDVIKATLHAKKPPAQAMLSIGGANSGPGTFSNMVSDGDNRAAFINSTITTARKYGFDGLDFDWEFPSNPSDMSNLSIFFEEWWKAVDSEASDSGKPPLLLSAAVYFASRFFIDTPRAYPVEAIAKYLDFVNPMCFDYHGSWDTSVTAGYGDATLWKSWKLKDPKNHGIGAPADGIGPGNNGILLYSDIVAYNDEHHASVVYDGETVSEYSYSGTDWIGYDGPTSVEKKVEYAKTKDLGGYFFWALGYDMNWTLSAIGSIKYMGRNALEPT